METESRAAGAWCSGLVSGPGTQQHSAQCSQWIEMSKSYRCCGNESGMMEAA